MRPAKAFTRRPRSSGRKRSGRCGRLRRFDVHLSGKTQRWRTRIGGALVALLALLLWLPPALPGFLDNVYYRGPISDHFDRSEEHTSELQSIMTISYAVFCLNKQ